jgi:3-oxoadipate CoA-transferase beta subunit
MAARLARDIPEGWYVNLGLGLPTLIPDYIPAGREVVFHSENGILGMGPVPPKDAVDTWLINATKQNITLLPGASIFHHADSFAIIRGGHLDLCVLGAYEVAENGDIANWATSANDTLPGVGGAMDLAAGSRQLWALMEHVTKDGRPRLVQRCNYPLTASGVVKRVYTNLAVLEVTARGFEVLDMAPGLTFDALQSKTDAKLHRPARSAAREAPSPRKEERPQPNWDPLAIVPKR